MNNRVNINISLFEGPLDLLLQLIRINEVDITDIPIADITRQYIEYLELLEDLDFEVAGEFLVMAATLMRIKARMLLPQTALLDEDDDWEDPRKELVERLLEYKKFKELSIHLGEKLDKYQDTYNRNFLLAGDDYSKGEIRIIESDLLALLVSYKKILTRLSNRIPEEIEGEEFTIEEKQEYLIAKLRFSKSIKFSDIFLSARSKNEIIITFMALLEMVRGGQIRARQTDLLGEIYLYGDEYENTANIN